MGGHYADVWLVDCFPRNLRRAATVGVAIFLTSLRRVKVLVSEAAELTLKHRPNFALELVYHPQTSGNDRRGVGIRIALNSWGILPCLRGDMKFDWFGAKTMGTGPGQHWRIYILPAIGVRLFQPLSIRSYREPMDWMTMAKLAPLRMSFKP